MQTFHFSPRPNRAHEIRWRSWGPEPLAEAGREEKPVLLNLTAAWCTWCHRLDETTYSDPELIDLLNEHFVAVRVDADRHPHVQDRYIAGGWPTTAFLTPTGEVLWAGTYVEPAEMRSVAGSVLAAWRDRRAEFEAEIERRRRALDAARNRHMAVGLVRREAADDVLTAVREAFDVRNGGFGDAPKFPAPEAVELLFLQGTRDPDCASMAERTLDGMLAGALFDAEAGAFFRYAQSSDWTLPAPEKLLTVNAGLVRAYAAGARMRGRDDWASAVARTVGWADVLVRADGLWGGSEAADEAHYQQRAAERQGASVDRTAYTCANAEWIGALAGAGASLGRPEWSAAAATALERLIPVSSAENELLYHVHEPDGAGRALAILAADLLAAASACLMVAEATGGARWLAEARRLAQSLERHFWAEYGGFHDRIRSPDDVGALRYRDRPFELNADAARFLLDLSHATGERKYRALAERVLALLSPQAGRFGVGGATFALAVEDFFEPGLRVFIVGEDGAADGLRAAALKLPYPGRRVWPATDGARIGPVQLRGGTGSVAYVCGPHGAAPPITDPADLEEAAAAVL
ncbi:MAG: DUF255 domain-containing protein [Longimicrobiales bacterium]